MLTFAVALAFQFGTGSTLTAPAGAASSYRGYAMSKFFSKFLRDESGASAAEYALILAIVGIGIVAAAGALRDAISGAMTRAATRINTAS